MRWVWIILATTLLALAGCGAEQVEAQPESVAAAAPEVVTVEVTRIVTVVVTATPTPIPPAQATLTAKLTAVALAPDPTATPTETPQPAVVPEGWNTYEFISGELTFAYPPTWKIENEKPDSVRVENTQNSYQHILIIWAGPELTGEYREQLRTLKSLFSGGTTMDTITFHREGQLAAPFQPAYVTATRRDYVYDSFLSGYLLTAATDGENSAYVQFGHVAGPSISDETFTLLTQIVGSVIFNHALDFN